MKHPVVQKQIEALVASYNEKQFGAAEVFIVSTSKSRKALKNKIEKNTNKLRRECLKIIKTLENGSSSQD